MRRIVVVHVINALNVGGAETALLRLLETMDSDRFEFSVVCLLDEGPLITRIRDLGVEVLSLRMSRGNLGVVPVARLARILRNRQPHIVHTWLYHADLVGGLAAFTTGGARVVWGIRQGTLKGSHHSGRTMAIIRCCGVASRWIPDRIVSCSIAAAAVHQALGYPSDRMVIIPNGVDVGMYRPDPAARKAMRAELGVAETTPLVGLVARFDPLKDHHSFCRAMRLVAKSRPGTEFLLAGIGVDSSNEILRRWLDEAGRENKVHLLGLRRDMPRVMAALDIAVSSSIAEGFSNTVVEASACGVPSVVTDVGDSAHIVGSAGVVVPPGEPLLLAEGITKLLDADQTERTRLGTAARARVVSEFRIECVAARYEALYRDLVGS